MQKFQQFTKDTHIEHMNAGTFKQSDAFGYVLLSGTFVALYLSSIPLTSQAQLVVATTLLSFILILKKPIFVFMKNLLFTTC